jgi:radical SAM superfamily enzyme YgiQ (UPF0313 family)
MKIEFIHLAKRDNKKLHQAAPLTFPTLAAVTPAYAEVSITDEALHAIDFDKSIDIVGITVILPFAPRAYEVSAEFRERGVTVVLGGPHVTSLPEEAQNHADAIVIGEADEIWPAIIDDFRKGRLKKIYRQQGPTNLNNIPAPRRDILPKGYTLGNSVMATRGCPYQCSYCSIHQVFPGYRKRPIGDVIAEIDELDGDNLIDKKLFIFWDDNIVAHVGYSKKLFKEIIPLKRHWISQSVMSIGQDKELVKLAGKSGCVGLFLGVESFNQKTLQEMNKSHNKLQKLKDTVQLLHDQGISVYAGIMFGFDDDDRSVFEKTLEIVTKLNIDLVNPTIVTPYPRTPLFDLIEKEKRFLTKDWSRFDGTNVVFRPKKMRPQELLEGWHWMRKEFYSRGSILRRLLQSHTALWLTLPMNIASRKFIYKTQERRMQVEQSY